MARPVFLMQIVLCFFHLAACAIPPVTTPPKDLAYWPTADWRTSTPEQQGMDSDVLSEVVAFIMKEKLPVDSLMIIKNGYVVLDAYFYPYHKGMLHDVASVTKSITASLIGLAHENGFIEDLKEPIVDFFPEYENRSKSTASITIHHLLTMTSGFACGYVPGEKELFEMIESPDWVAFALQMPMAVRPGTAFSYCSNGMHLLSAIVGRATGMPALDFAERFLFSPLGIEDVVWPADPQGVNLGGGDLRMHPADMARIGYLYLRHGQWDGQRILSTTWVNVATTKQIDVDNRPEGYGYGWWIFPNPYDGMFGARGRGGQEILVWPQHDLVLVLTANGAHIDSFSHLLMKSFASKAALPENRSAYGRLSNRVRSAS